jgi:hypothetical protein
MRSAVRLLQAPQSTLRVQREDDKMGCAGSNVAKEIRLYTSGAMIRVSLGVVKQAARLEVDK